MGKGTVPLSGKLPDPCYRGPAPQPVDPKTGLHGDYWVLPEEELAMGFIRPFRIAYRHILCGQTTTMHKKIAATYAAQPDYYQATFCATCRAHFPVGAEGEFEWEDGSKVGT